jgi:hypothetical protein
MTVEKFHVEIHIFAIYVSNGLLKLKTINETNIDSCRNDCIYKTCLHYHNLSDFSATQYYT